MLMKKQDMINCVTALAKAKNEQDVAGALKIYHFDAELVAPTFSAHARGRNELERSLQYFFHLFPDYHVAVSDYVETDTGLHAQGFIKVTPNTVKGKAKTATIPASMAFEFADNAIIKETFNIDLSLLAKKTGLDIEDLSPAKKND